jgi:cell division transport system permease protein
MGTLFYFIREGIRGFFQAKLMTFLSIVTIAVVLLLASVLAVGVISVRALLEKAVERADFVVYVKERTAADPASLAALLTAVRNLPQVHQAALVDKSAAWERFAAMYGREMLGAVNENPLPVSIEITAKKNYQSLSAAAGLKQRFEALDGVEAVRYAGEWMDFLTKFKWYFYIGVIFLAVVMFITLHSTISNTIRLTIYARNELVRNMHLVGATRFFIAMPFIIEGMIQGLVGGVIAVVFFFMLKTVFMVAPSLRVIPLAWGPPVLPVIVLLLGVLFGWIGSAFAIRKFLA